MVLSVSRIVGFLPQVHCNVFLKCWWFSSFSELKALSHLPGNSYKENTVLTLFHSPKPSSLMWNKLLNYISHLICSEKTVFNLICSNLRVALVVKLWVFKGGLWKVSLWNHLRQRMYAVITRYTGRGNNPKNILMCVCFVWRLAQSFFLPFFLPQPRSFSAV